MNLSPVIANRITTGAKFVFTGLLAGDIDRLPTEPVQPKPTNPVLHGFSVDDIQAVIDALAGLTSKQQKAVKTLLEAERQHASRWWTYLNEMRFSGDMPDWAKSQDVGTHPDYDRWDNDRKMLNLALFGSKDVYPLGPFLSVRFDL